MPKLTRKYAGALPIARRLDIADVQDQERLYAALQEQCYFWDSAGGVWTFTALAAADEPTPLVRVRVWAATERVEQAASEIATFYTGRGYTLSERSAPYVCRPPKQRESRVYLAFVPPQECP